MLPRASGDRNQRNGSQPWQWTALPISAIGRSLRAALDMMKLGENALYVTAT
jgi:ribonuclease PH